MSSCTEVWHVTISVVLIGVMNRISLTDKPAAFLFICLCRLIDIDLGKDYIFHSSLPPVWSLSILSIRKGGILSLLVWAERTQRTQRTQGDDVNESLSPTGVILNTIYRDRKHTDNQFITYKQV